MKTFAFVFALLGLWLATSAFAAGPPLPTGWRLPEWWDLEGKDPQILMGDFNGDGAVDMATIAVREDSPVIGLLVWYAGQSGAGKWLVLDQQKRPQSLPNWRFETHSDETNPNRSDILYCLAVRECLFFSWDDEGKKLKRSIQPRKKQG